MFTQLYLNDSFMIRKIIVAAVPAALVAVGMSLAISEPASSQFSSNYQQQLLNEGGGGTGAMRDSYQNKVDMGSFEYNGAMSFGENSNLIYPAPNRKLGAIGGF